MFDCLRAFWPKGNQRENLGKEPPELRLLKSTNARKARKRLNIIPLALKRQNITIKLESKYLTLIK